MNETTNVALSTMHEKHTNDMLHEGFMVKGCSKCRFKLGCTPSCWQQRARLQKQRMEKVAEPEEKSQQWARRLKPSGFRPQSHYHETGHFSR